MNVIGSSPNFVETGSSFARATGGRSRFVDVDVDRLARCPVGVCMRFINWIGLSESRNSRHFP